MALESCDDSVEQAQVLAEFCHLRQKRKGTGDPYIFHPARVAGLVAAQGCGKQTVAAAWLHDILEDASDLNAVEYLESCFNSTVVGLVKDLTNPAEGSPAPRLDRVFEQFYHIGLKSVDAKIIKLADRYDNISERERRAEGNETVARYAAETELLTCIIPREVCPDLWKSIVNTCNRILMKAEPPESHKHGLQEQYKKYIDEHFSKDLGPDDD